MNFKNTDTKGNFELKHYHENYGFDLEAVLSKHPIKELANDSHKDDLMNSLKKGNLQSATFLKDGQEVKQYIEATPQYKTLTIYDENLKRLDTRQAKEQSQGEGQAAKQESKKQQKAADEDGPGDQQEKKQRRKKQSM